MFKYIVKIFATKIHLQTLGRRWKVWSNQGKWKTGKRLKGYLRLVFSIKDFLFLSVFSPINLKSLSPFNFSPVFTNHRQLFLSIWCDHANSEPMTLRFCFLEGESQLKYIFCKKIVSKIYAWLLKLFECLFLSYPRSRLPRIIVSKMNISSITSEWLHFFHNNYNDKMIAKLEHCVILFNNKNVLSSSYDFY